MTPKSGGNFGSYTPDRKALTPRMLDIAEQVLAGNTSLKGIAQALGMAPQTVKNILGVMYQRLGVESKMELVVKHQNGLIAIPRRELERFASCDHVNRAPERDK